ncbi:MAG: hypothetical protein DDT23_01011 [candidate division WS2 bacterium]|nr:hypothetical protein [Candidatus Lithacetigena glycinireducens]
MLILVLLEVSLRLYLTSEVLKGIGSRSSFPCRAFGVMIVNMGSIVRHEQGINPLSENLKEVGFLLPFLF